VSRPETDRLIDALAHDLTPVRPVAPLPGAVAIVALAGAASIAAYAWSRGGLPLRPDLAARLDMLSPFAPVAFGLGALAVGALLAALAAREPGRRAPAAFAVAAFGVLLGPAALAAFFLLGGRPPEPPAVNDAGCLLRGLLLGLPPAAAALALAARGAALRPVAAAALVGAASAALGAVVVHLGCPANGIRHVLVSHALTPLAGALLTLPFAPLLARWRRASPPRRTLERGA
jgi:hypothetical protein